jgi:hypothetical protein
LFSSKRVHIQQEILNAVVSEAPGEAIAVERKLEQSQITQEYGFRIQRERLESQRKQIEAEGIQAFQQTVQAGISEAYLKWRGIEATLQLATSQNSKVVIVGGGSHGMPLILNTDDTPRGPVAPPAGAVPADPAKLQKAGVERSARVEGSIDTTPPPVNVSVEDLIDPASKQSAAEIAAGLNDTAPGDAPYMLRSFADAFGYRLERIAPATSEAAVGPNERPR